MVTGIMNLMTHSKIMNVVVKPVTGYLDHVAIASSYGVFKLGRGKIDVCLRNHSEKQITFQKWTAVGEITAVNIIPALMVPKPTGHEAVKDESSAGKRKYKSQKELLDMIDLTRLGEWSQN